jgi:phosphopantothenoylcysteine decarboxylase
MDDNPRGRKRARDDDAEGEETKFTFTTDTPSPAFRAADFADDGKNHLLVASTGSVATIKIPNILRALSRHPKLAIRVVLSKSSARFLQSQADEQPHWKSLRSIPNVEAVYTDEDEWHRPWTRGAPILHIELRRWADMMIIAPLSANAMAKMVNGICDDIISEVCRAWDVDSSIDGSPKFAGSKKDSIKQENGTASVDGKKGAVGGDLMSSKYASSSFTPTPARVPVGQIHKKKKIILVAPAMNTAMWRHPVTRSHMRQLDDHWSVAHGGWIEVLRPQEKPLACGDTGDGAMMGWEALVNILEEKMGLDKWTGGEERDVKRLRT